MALHTPLVPLNLNPDGSKIEEDILVVYATTLGRSRGGKTTTSDGRDVLWLFMDDIDPNNETFDGEPLYEYVVTDIYLPQDVDIGYTVCRSFTNEKGDWTPSFDFVKLEDDAPHITHILKVSRTLPEREGREKDGAEDHRDPEWERANYIFEHLTDAFDAVFDSLHGRGEYNTYHEFIRDPMTKDETLLPQYTLKGVTYTRRALDCGLPLRGLCIGLNPEQDRIEEGVPVIAISVPPSLNLPVNEFVCRILYLPQYRDGRNGGSDADFVEDVECGRGLVMKPRKMGDEGEGWVVWKMAFKAG